MTTNKYALPKKAADIALKHGRNVSEGLQNLGAMSESLEEIARITKFLLENFKDERDDSTAEWERESARSERAEYIQKMDKIIGEDV